MPRPPLADHVRNYIDWLNSGNDDADRETGRLLGMAPAERDAWLAAHPEIANFHTFSELLGVATSRLREDPGLSLEVTALVVRHLDELRGPYEVPLAMLRMQAWRLHGQALRVSGDLDTAVAALDRAMALGSTASHSVPEMLCARRELAFIDHLRGHSAEALRTLDSLIPEYESYNDAGGVTWTVLYQSDIELARGDLPRARANAEAALQMADDLDYPALQAEARYRLAGVAEAMGDREGAALHARLAGELGGGG